MNQDRVLFGVTLMLGFCITAPLIDVTSKLATQGGMSVGEVTTARFVVQAALMAPLLGRVGPAFRLSARAWWWLFQRAVYLALSTYCFVAAIKVMPIADALAIVFVEPFIIMILGSLLFGDQVGPRRLIASAFGFGGSLLVIQPAFTNFGAVALFPLGTAVSFAFYMLVTRALAREVRPIQMQFHTSLIAAALCLPVLWAFRDGGFDDFRFIPPAGLNWVWLAAVGATSAVAHLFMTYALRFAPSATLAPLHYLEIVSAAGFSYLVFSDFPDLLTWVGICVIVASGLYVIHRERMSARAFKTEVKA